MYTLNKKKELGFSQLFSFYLDNAWQIKYNLSRDFIYKGDFIMDNLGHIFRVRHPDDPERWIDIPVMFQTMYQAYVTYCQANNIPEDTMLDERSYYITLGTLKDIADTLSGYAGTIPLESGGTGTSVTNLNDLLTYLGLSSDVNSVGNKFPTTEAIKNYVDTEVEEAKQKASLELQLRFSQFLTAAQDGNLNDLGITSGTGNPGTATPGTIYIKYSD